MKFKINEWFYNKLAAIISPKIVEEIFEKDIGSTRSRRTIKKDYLMLHIPKEKLEKYFRLIEQGKMTYTEAAKNLNVNYQTLRYWFLKKHKEKRTRRCSIIKTIDKEKLVEAFKKVKNQETTMTQASREMGIKIQTFRYWFLKWMNSENV